MQIHCPLTNASRETFRILLDGQLTQITVYWQYVDESWYLDVSLPSRGDLVTGIRLKPNIRILGHRKPNNPSFIGDFFVAGPGDSVPRFGWTEGYRLIWFKD